MNLSCQVTFAISEQTKNHVRMGIGRTARMLILRCAPFQSAIFRLDWREGGIFRRTAWGGSGVSRPEPHPRTSGRRDGHRDVPWQAAPVEVRTKVYATAEPRILPRRFARESVRLNSRRVQ